MKILSPTSFQQLPDAILFDIDNTLYSYKEPHEAALVAVKDKAMKTFSIKSLKMHTMLLQMLKLMLWYFLN